MKPSTFLRRAAWWFPMALVLAACGQEKSPNMVGLRAAASRLEPLMTRKTAPQAGDWLASQREPGQTFEQYLATNPNRPSQVRTKLYLRLIGDFSPQQERLADAAREYLGIHYGLPVELLPRIELDRIPASARRVHPGWKVPQILTTYVLDEVLKPERPRDAVAVLALSATDLWPGKGWNFVFGQASLNDRVGVWSIVRFGDPAEKENEVLRRTVQVAAHETGHMLGILHCTAHECGMNGSNSLAESDRAPLAFCSECELKVWWACHLAPVARQEALLRFLEEHRLKRDADEARRRLGALKAER